MMTLQARRRSASGMTILEVMVACALLMIVFLGLAETFRRGRGQVDLEEDRRKATAVVQARLDGIRRDWRYDDLPGLDGTDTTLVVDGAPYTITHDVEPGVPEAQATTLTLTVTWFARVAGNDVPRSQVLTTILGRGMPVQ